MATKSTTELKTDRPTYATEFIKSDAEQAVFLGNPILDNMMTTMLAMCSETWAIRRRTNVIERLLTEKGITHDMIEGYMPTPEDEAEWQAERNRFIEATLGPLLRDGSLPISAEHQDED